MVTGVELLTATVVAWKVMLLVLASTVTLAGTVTALLLLPSETKMPPVGAGPVRVTVPVDGLPPTTEVGFTLTAESAGGFTVSVAVTDTLLYEAVIVTGVEPATATVLTGKVALVALAATLTLVATVAALLLLCSETEMPPAGAGPARVTVPVDPVGPTTAVGFTLTDESSGLTVSVVVTLAPPYEAVIVTAVEVLTPRVVTGKVAELALAATFTLVGTVAALLLLCSETVMPPAGAGPAMVTVPVDGLGPATAVGFTLTDEIASGLIVSVAGVGVTEL